MLNTLRRLPYFKNYAQDWLSSNRVELMSLAQVGAYWVLLCKAWCEESCTLVPEPEQLKILARWRDDTDGDFAPVLACFPLTRNGKRRYNPRLFKERQEALHYHAQQSEGGKKGMQARWAKPTKERPVVNGSSTWDAYQSAYQTRYQVPPVRNQQVNSQLKQLVSRVGADEAPQLAAFYLTHNKPLYVSARHPTNLLLRDCEGLRTEWATGIKATSSEARQAEVQDDARAQVNRVRASMEARKHGHT